MSNSDRISRKDKCSNIIVEAPLVLPYPPSNVSKDLWLETRKRRIEDAFERAKSAREVLETRVLISDIPDLFPSLSISKRRDREHQD
jgi:hypothetical protein